MGFQVPLTTCVGFIGAGQMAEAIARGLNKAGVIPAERIYTSKGSRKESFESFGVKVVSNSEVISDTTFSKSENVRTIAIDPGKDSDFNALLRLLEDLKVVENSKVIVMAVKPQMLKPVLIELKPKLTKDHLLVSIAAGITINSLQEWGGDVRVVRVIPNTPSLVGEGAAEFLIRISVGTAISAGPSSTQGDVDLVKALFDSIGKTVVVEEKLLNAVTGVSGSGPAFVYIAIEAMADGGVAAGLPRSVALSLAAQTFLGSAKMVLETKRHPGQLKDEVASPAGTTIAGLHELEKAGFRGAWMNAVLATAKRGEQLGGLSK